MNQKQMKFSVRMRRRHRDARPILGQVLLLAALTAVLPLWLSAQSVTGAIQGRVVDPTDLAVIGARVALLNVAQRATRETVTNAAGEFYFGSLQPGEYELSVEVEGFKRFEQRSILLTASETRSLGALQLEVGAVTESISVTAQGAPVQTQTAERAGVLTSSQVETLAIRGRNVTSLLSLLPGVVDLANSEQLATNWNLYVNGSRRNTNNVTLDGATINAIGNNFNSVVTVSMDAIAEVKVLQSNYQAEYGRMSGANIQLVTKSGTSDFHGLFSYWKRHEQFNANEFFNNRIGQPKPRYRFNTWNYNVSGPIFIPGKLNSNRDKLFFFWSQEYWPQKTTKPIAYLTVPTELERAGDFSQSLDVNNRMIVVRDPLARAPFPGNVVPANRVDPNGRALLGVFPNPNFLDRSVSKGNYNYVFQDEQRTPVTTASLKVDYHLSSNDILSLSYTRRNNKSTGALAGTVFDQMRGTFEQKGDNLVVRHQKILSPTLINELNLSYSSRPTINWVEEGEIRRNQRDVVGFDVGQLYPENNPLNLIPNTTFGGVPSAARTKLDNRLDPNRPDGHGIFTFSDSISKTLSGHTLKAGIYADHYFLDGYNQFGAFMGDIDFSRDVNNPLDTNYAYSNAILGVFKSYSEVSARPRFDKARATNVEWFVQDNWRASPRLTLDVGVRFYFTPHSTVDDDSLAGFRAANYDRAKQVQLIQPVRIGGKRLGQHPVTGEVYPAALIGAVADGTGDPANGMVSHLLDPTVPRSLMANHGIKLAPRIGLAYDVFGNGKTAIRSGFGLFYNRISQGMVVYPYQGQPPFTRNTLIQYGELTGLLDSQGVVFPATVLGLDPVGKIPSVMNFSFGVQQDIGFGTVVDISYVGSLGRHLMWARNLNAIPFGTNFDPANTDPTTGKPFPAVFLRPYPGYNNINVREMASTSNYHSMQMSANRRFARGLDFGASWTWSKAMDFNDNDGNPVSTLVPVRVWNYGLAGFDRTHILKVNWIYAVPDAPWTNPILKQAFNGWQLGGIASFSSGAPLGVGFSTTQAVDITGSPTDGARVMVTGDPVLPKGERTFERYFNTDVFALPAFGTIGNAAKTVIRGPGINNFDLSVYKNFPIWESVRLQFRWELYNAFNHTQFSGVATGARFDPQGNQVNARFGELTSARPARRMQFALRLYF